MSSLALLGPRSFAPELTIPRLSYVRVWQKGKPNVGCDPADRREYLVFVSLDES